MDISLNLPSLSGAGLPQEVESHLESMYSALREFAEQIRQKANNPNYITVEGESLAARAKNAMLQENDVILHWGELAPARRRKEWKVCEAGYADRPDMQGFVPRGAPAEDDASSGTSDGLHYHTSGTLTAAVGLPASLGIPATGTGTIGLSRSSHTHPINGNTGSSGLSAASSTVPHQNFIFLIRKGGV